MCGVSGGRGERRGRIKSQSERRVADHSTDLIVKSRDHRVSQMVNQSSGHSVTQVITCSVGWAVSQVINQSGGHAVSQMAMHAVRWSVRQGLPPRSHHSKQTDYVLLIAVWITRGGLGVGLIILMDSLQSSDTDLFSHYV